MISEDMLKKYISEKLSANKIAEVTNIPDYVIRKKAIKYGLKEQLLINGKLSQGKSISINQYEQVKQLLLQQKITSEISRVTQLSQPTINKIAKKYDLHKELHERNKQAKGAKRYKDGRGIYRRFKKDFCEKCNVKSVKLYCHHIKPANYDNKWQITDSDNSKENIITVCNSCHQKIHYRELKTRIPMLSDGCKFYSRKGNNL